MSLFGNTFIQENKIKEDNEPLLVIIDVELDNFHWNLLLDLQKKYNNELLHEDSKSSQKFILKDKDESQNVIIFLRNRYEQGARSGQVSQHDASIKIEKPKILQNISISVPRTDSGKEIEIKGKIPTKYKKAEDNIKKFIKDNTYEIRNIFYSENPTSIEKSYKKLIRDNDNIEIFGADENDDIYNYYLSYRKGINK